MNDGDPVTNVFPGWWTAESHKPTVVFSRVLSHDEKAAMVEWYSDPSAEWPPPVEGATRLDGNQP